MDDDSSNEIIFSKGLLQSKYLVVIIGMKYFHLTAAFDSQAGAGVSKAAGMQPFRGPGGLLTGSRPSKSGNILDLFDKDTFQVKFHFVLFYRT
jgi:hypothetical protein